MQARARIIEVAEALMRSQPIDDVTIAQITAAADVGHGSFYMHFKSKYEVLVPILEAQAAAYDAQMRPWLDAMSDPAEVMGFAMRYAGRRILADDLWRWFLQHSGVPANVMQNTFSRYSHRDFARGVASGRFSVPNALVADAFGFGSHVNVLLLAMNAENPAPMLDDCAELMLRAMGVPADDAHQIAHTAYPELEILR